MDTLDIMVLEAEILAEFPDFKMVPKSSSKLMSLVFGFLQVVTFGNSPSFMTDYTTTIGHTVYTPMGWDSWVSAERCEILRHERVHMRQSKKYSSFLYSFLYLFGFFPVGLAFFRMKFEMEAYTESLRAWKERGENLLDPSLKTRYVSYFTGPAYLWAWPFKKYVENWFDTTIQTILKEP